MSGFDHPYLDHDGPVAFAHRGGTSFAPENTMAAFRHAVDIGYRYLETDVHRTRDGELFAFHDPDLSRTCGIDRSIVDMTAPEVERARVAGEHPIPRMADLFEAFPEVRFNIDAKSDESVEPLAALVTRFGAIDRVCLASFKRSRLRRLGELLGPRLLTALSPAEIASLRFTGRVPGGGPRAAQVPPRARRIEVVTEQFVERAHRQGIAVHVWTIDERAEMERLLDLGVDGIMTDDPDLLREVLVDREAWPSAPYG